MRNINEILLDERYDLPIMECLMYQPIGASEFAILDSGKSGDSRIYQVLKQIEKEKGIKL